MHEFNWFEWFAGHFFGISLEGYLHVVASAFVVLLLLMASILVWRRLKNLEACLIPPSKVTLTNIFENGVEAILGLMEGILGEERARRYFSLIGALFIYILTCNLIGLIPGLNSPTDNINTNAACAIVVFVYYNALGIKTHGLAGYLKHFAGPIVWMAPFLFIIELISHLVRPLSLSVRLFGNITGDHLLLSIFSDLVPLVVPVVFMLLAILVAFIQAFIFSLLSIIYIALGTEEAH